MGRTEHELQMLARTSRIVARGVVECRQCLFLSGCRVLGALCTLEDWLLSELP